MKIFKNKENLLILVLSLVLVATLTIGIVRAYLYTASNVTYSNSNISGSNTQQAIEALNNKACPSNAICQWKKSWSNVAVGDYVQMTPSVSSYTTDKSKTGYTSTQTIYPQELKLWRVIKTSPNIELVSEYVSSINIGFGGATGYANFVGYLNTLAKQYENPTYTSGSRHMGYNGQTQVIGDTTENPNSNTSAFDGTSTSAPWKCSTGSTSSSCIPKPQDNESLGGGDTLYTTDTDRVTTAVGTLKAKKCSNSTCSSVGAETSYWLASRYYDYASTTSFRYIGRGVTASGNVSTWYIRFYSSSWTDANNNAALRPIITLKSGLSVSDAVGSSNDPFVLG